MSRRDVKAATKFFRKLLTGLRSVPQMLVMTSWPATVRGGPPPTDARCKASPVGVSE
jgi:hypothetical protein